MLSQPCPSTQVQCAAKVGMYPLTQVQLLLTRNVHKGVPLTQVQCAANHEGVPLTQVQCAANHKDVPLTQVQCAAKVGMYIKMSL